MKLHELLSVTPQRSGDVWLIEDIPYTQKEARIMSNMVDKDKLAVHDVKKIFGGEVR